jgi:hypothetical protein
MSPSGQKRRFGDAGVSSALPRTADAALADRRKQLRGRDFAAGRDPLGHVINYLMTELWDRSFSQSEIRAAFVAAVEDMNRYTAGQDWCEFDEGQTTGREFVVSGRDTPTLFDRDAEASTLRVDARELCGVP